MFDLERRPLTGESILPVRKIRGELARQRPSLGVVAVSRSSFSASESEIHSFEILGPATMMRNIRRLGLREVASYPR
jgi:hypothetical protein